MIKNNFLFKPQFWIGVMISLLGIYWSFKDFNLKYSFSLITELEYKWIFFAIVLLLVSLIVRSIRWKFLFKSSDNVKVYSLYMYQLIGYFGNNVLPLRLGEILRAYLLGSDYNLSKSYVLGTIILERILDTFSLVFLAVILLVFYPLDTMIKNYIYMCLLIVLISLGVLIAINHFRVSKSNNFFLSNFFYFLNGLKNIKKDKILEILIYSISIWMIYWINVYFIQLAFNLDLHFIESLVILVITSLFMSIPSAPGMIGTFHLGVKYVMESLFDFPADLSTMFAIILHAYTYVVYTILGAYYFVKKQAHKDIVSKVSIK